MCFQQFFVKVTIAVSSANQKCNAQKNKKKNINYCSILFVWVKYFVSQPKKYTDCRFLRRECQGILQEGWSQRYKEAISNFHYSSNCIK